MSIEKPTTGQSKTESGNEKKENFERGVEKFRIAREAEIIALSLAREEKDAFFRTSKLISVAETGNQEALEDAQLSVESVQGGCYKRRSVI